MNIKQKIDSMYDKEYFESRDGTDEKRQKAFDSEKEFINDHIEYGTLLDVGCSTGEFIKALDWVGETYGMEVSPYARTEAEKNGIRFDKNLLTEKQFFDIITMRGVAQHLDTPFYFFQKAHEALKIGGILVFLATPNSNSIYFKLWNTLPLLDAPRNFYVPSDKELINALSNIGFRLVEIRYPYVGSPYANYLLDHFKFFMKLIGFNVSFAFWRNSMDLILEKVE